MSNAQAPVPPPDRPWRTQFMNLTVYHLLISMVNLLNLPLPKGTYVPRRSFRLTVFMKDVDHLKMLKDELDQTNPAAVRAYLLSLKGILFEIGFLLEQDPELARNPDFFEGFERLENLLYNAQGVEDFRELAHLAYTLSILLPFYEEAGTLAQRREQAGAFDKRKSGP